MRVRAIAVSTILSAVAFATAASAAAPDAPSTLRKDRLNPDEVLLTWDDRSDDEDGFEIFRRELTEQEFTSRGTVGANVTEFIDDVPKSNDVFIYQVVAFNEDGDSGLTNQCYVNRTPPAVPLQFNARLIALTVVRVSWSDRSNGERSFEIQRKPLGGRRFKTVARPPANTETIDDILLDPANTYVYRMRALGKTGNCIDNSKFTPERVVTTKGGVRILQVEVRGRGDGMITSDPEGISCGVDDDHCVAEFPIARDVTLIAKAKPGSRFNAWYNVLVCEDTKGPCTFNMGKDRVVEAQFKRN